MCINLSERYIVPKTTDSKMMSDSDDKVEPDYKRFRESSYIKSYTIKKSTIRKELNKSVKKA